MKRFLFLVPLLWLAACGGGSDATPAKKLIIAGARLEQGPGKPVIPYSMVIVEDGKFKAVGEQADVPVPKDSQILNGLDHTLAPLAPGGSIEVGQAANLTMKDAKGHVRTMREGQWQQ